MNGSDPGSPVREASRQGSGTAQARVARLALAVLAGASLGFWTALAAGVAGNAKPPAPVHAAPDSSHLLQFVDGGLLHGRLRSMNVDESVHWEHPAAKRVIKFQPSGIASIKFENPKRVTTDALPTCRFQFANGDEVFGHLKSLDEQSVRLQSWFGGDLQAPRAGLHAITFFPKGYAVLYEGPTAGDGWTFAQGAKGWRYRDGGFVADGVGTLGRDLKLAGSCSLEFELTWSGGFSLSLMLFTEVVDRLDYSANSYMFHLAPGYASLQRVQAGVGVMSLGHQVQIQDMAQKSKARLEIRANREQATLSLLVDGVVVSQWKDHSGFVGKGSGVVFSSQLDGPTLRLSNIKVSQWEGLMDPHAPIPSAPSEDLLYLANRDTVGGELKGIIDGNLALEIPQTTLAIPLERVTQVVFKQAEAKPAAKADPWQVRVDVSGGGTISLRLENWDEARVKGNSPNFGQFTVDPASIRQVQFSGRALPIDEPPNNAGAEELWELDE